MSGPRPGGSFDHTLVDCRPGFVSVMFEGRGARALFADEGGGHRWQRVPPNERRGRVHTSTITVAVLSPPREDRVEIAREDLEIKKSLGTGPGGQHRNKTESCVTLKHLPTGIVVRVDMRSQHQSLAMAMRILAAKLKEQSEEGARLDRDRDRRAQVGSGMRGDKIRTYRSQDDRVTDHRTERVSSLSSWMRGNW